jgi:cyanophycinase
MPEREGRILLAGGSEFGGSMAAPDRRAIELAGGPDSPVRILPAAAAPDRNHRRAGENGVRWFSSLGARNVSWLPLIDRATADDSALAGEIRNARLIYLPGGFPFFLYQTLAGSLCWQAVLEAHRAGAVVGGSSAGAMVLCANFFDPEDGRIVEGLNLVREACFIPHHNVSGKRWVARLAALLPGATILGVDEQTGVIDDGPGGSWNVYGKGRATLYAGGGVKSFGAGQHFAL